MLIDSVEEQYFIWYLEELCSNEYISDFKRGNPYQLSPLVTENYSKILKTKIKIIEKTLLREHVYTPDFVIFWTNKAEKTFITGEILENKSNYPFYANNNNESYIEIKPIFFRNNMIRLFSINQKWMYDKYKIYVQKIIPQKLMELTFTPNKYLKTTITQKDRKINFQTRTLEEFINLKK